MKLRYLLLAFSFLITTFSVVRIFGNPPVACAQGNNCCSDGGWVWQHVGGSCEADAPGGNEWQRGYDACLQHQCGACQAPSTPNNGICESGENEGTHKLDCAVGGGNYVPPAPASSTNTSTTTATTCSSGSPTARSCVNQAVNSACVGFDGKCIANGSGPNGTALCGCRPANIDPCSVGGTIACARTTSCNSLGSGVVPANGGNGCSTGYLCCSGVGTISSSMPSTPVTVSTPNTSSGTTTYASAPIAGGKIISSSAYCGGACTGNQNCVLRVSSGGFVCEDPIVSTNGTVVGGQILQQTSFKYSRGCGAQTHGLSGDTFYCDDGTCLWYGEIVPYGQTCGGPRVTPRPATPRPNGTSCTTSTQCVSGYCAITSAATTTSNGTGTCSNRPTPAPTQVSGLNTYTNNTTCTSGTQCQSGYCNYTFSVNGTRSLTMLCSNRPTPLPTVATATTIPTPVNPVILPPCSGYTEAIPETNRNTRCQTVTGSVVAISYQCNPGFRDDGLTNHTCVASTTPVAPVTPVPGFNAPCSSTVACPTGLRCLQTLAGSFCRFPCGSSTFALNGSQPANSTQCVTSTGTTAYQCNDGLTYNLSSNQCAPFVGPVVAPTNVAVNGICAGTGQGNCQSGLTCTSVIEGTSTVRRCKAPTPTSACPTSGQYTCACVGASTNVAIQPGQTCSANAVLQTTPLRNCLDGGPFTSGNSSTNGGNRRECWNGSVVRYECTPPTVGNPPTSTNPNWVCALPTTVTTEDLMGKVTVPVSGQISTPQPTPKPVSDKEPTQRSEGQSCTVLSTGDINGNCYSQFQCVLEEDGRFCRLRPITTPTPVPILERIGNTITGLFASPTPKVTPKPSITPKPTPKESVETGSLARLINPTSTPLLGALNQACRSGASPCNSGLECKNVGARAVCLLSNGQSCSTTSAGNCFSGYCRPPGGPSQPSICATAPSATPRPTPSPTPTTGALNQACRTGGVCNSGLTCKALSLGSSCLMSDGQPCSNDGNCHSGYCRPSGTSTGPRVCAQRPTPIPTSIANTCAQAHGTVINRSTTQGTYCCNGLQHQGACPTTPDVCPANAYRCTCSGRATITINAGQSCPDAESTLRIVPSPSPSPSPTPVPWNVRVNTACGGVAHGALLGRQGGIEYHCCSGVVQEGRCEAPIDSFGGDIAICSECYPVGGFAGNNSGCGRCPNDEYHQEADNKYYCGPSSRTCRQACSIGTFTCLQNNTVSEYCSSPPYGRTLTTCPQGCDVATGQCLGCRGECIAPAVGSNLGGGNACGNGRQPAQGACTNSAQICCTRYVEPLTAFERCRQRFTASPLTTTSECLGILRDGGVQVDTIMANAATQSPFGVSISGYSPPSPTPTPRTYMRCNGNACVRTTNPNLGVACVNGEDCRSLKQDGAACTASSECQSRNCVSAGFGTAVCRPPISTAPGANLQGSCLGQCVSILTLGGMASCPVGQDVATGQCGDPQRFACCVQPVSANIEQRQCVEQYLQGESQLMNLQSDCIAFLDQAGYGASEQVSNYRLLHPDLVGREIVLSLPEGIATNTVRSIINFAEAAHDVNVAAQHVDTSNAGQVVQFGLASFGYIAYNTAYTAADIITTGAITSVDNSISFANERCSLGDVYCGVHRLGAGGNALLASAALVEVGAGARNTFGSGADPVYLTTQGENIPSIGRYVDDVMGEGWVDDAFREADARIAGTDTLDVRQVSTTDDVRIFDNSEANSAVSTVDDPLVHVVDDADNVADDIANNADACILGISTDELSNSGKVLGLLTRCAARKKSETQLALEEVLTRDPDELILRQPMPGERELGSGFNGTVTVYGDTARKIFRQAADETQLFQIAVYRELNGAGGIPEFRGTVVNGSGDIVGFDQQFIRGVSLEDCPECLTPAKAEELMQNLEQLHQVSAHQDIIHYETLADGSEIPRLNTEHIVFGDDGNVYFLDAAGANDVSVLTDPANIARESQNVYEALWYLGFFR